jgi:hypothetical protein
MERKHMAEFVDDVVVLARDLIGTYRDQIWPFTVNRGYAQFALSSDHMRAQAKSSGLRTRRLLPLQREAIEVDLKRYPQGT